MVVRYVADGAQPRVPALVYEHLVNFIVMEGSNGGQLKSTLLHELVALGLDV